MLKPKPEPLTVWLVDGVMFIAGARGGGEGGCGSMPESGCLSPPVLQADRDMP